MKNLAWWLVPIALTAGALYWFYTLSHRQAVEPPQVAAPLAQVAPPPVAPLVPQAPTHFPVPETPAPELPKEIPTLEESDSALRQALVGLLGQGAFDNLIWPKDIVRRIVATIDNLPRGRVAQSVLPVKKAPGKFTVAQNGDGLTIDAANAQRYRVYVAALDAVDSHRLVALYAHFYPLFQQAYKDLGYPNAYFNDRLIAVLDDLLAAPEPAQPPRLAEPHLMYQYADPDIEALSAGQKTMIRIGVANEIRVKGKLREIRALLAKGDVPTSP
jgi:hypothetical protein